MFFFCRIRRRNYTGCGIDRDFPFDKGWQEERGEDRGDCLWWGSLGWECTVGCGISGVGRVSVVEREECEDEGG